MGNKSTLRSWTFFTKGMRIQGGARIHAAGVEYSGDQPAQRGARCANAGR
jgi:hypothetical protein